MRAGIAIIAAALVLSTAEAFARVPSQFCAASPDGSGLCMGIKPFKRLSFPSGAKGVYIIAGAWFTPDRPIAQTFTGTGFIDGDLFRFSLENGSTGMFSISSREGALIREGVKVPIRERLPAVRGPDR
jgi:hypothetical protein